MISIISSPDNRVHVLLTEVVAIVVRVTSDVNGRVLALTLRSGHTVEVYVREWEAVIETWKNFHCPIAKSSNRAIGDSQ